MLLITGERLRVRQGFERAGDAKRGAETDLRGVLRVVWESGREGVLRVLWVWDVGTNVVGGGGVRWSHVFGGRGAMD